MRARPGDQLDSQLHIGVLLDNVPEYLFWLGGAALAGAVVVGINPTRRGPELARDIRFTECRMIVTDAAGAELLDGLDTGVPDSHVIRTDGVKPDGAFAHPAGSGLSDDETAQGPSPEVSPNDLLVLLFTSGTTGRPRPSMHAGKTGHDRRRASEIYGSSSDRRLLLPDAPVSATRLWRSGPRLCTWAHASL